MKSQRGITLIVMLLTIIIILTAGFMFFFRSEKTNETTSSVSVSPTTKVTPTINFEISGWSSYFDEATGISFLYPSEMPQSDYRDNNNKGVSFTLIGPTQIASGRTQSSLAEGAIVRMLIIPNSEAQTEANKQHARETDAAPGDPTPVVTPINTITIDGKPAYQYKVEGMGNAKLTFLQVNSSVAQFTTIFAGFSEEEEKYYEELADKIISTIKLSN